MATKKASTPAPALACSKSEDDYRCEDDHRTLTRAAEITADKDRMAGVRKHHLKTTRALARVGQVVMGPSMTKPGKRPAGSRGGSRMNTGRAASRGSR